MSLAQILESHRVVVCVGSGGVGKTTTAAALAVHAAMQGQRVLCLTIDPAKRLANSLGLDELRTEEQRIDRALFERMGLQVRGELSAMMLDTKRTFDDLVHRHASSPARAERILKNRLYQYVSTSLAGTQEYMAMEKLYAVRRDPRFDLVVLDTPPTANAIDFLDAPQRLVGALDSQVMRWLIQAFDGKLSFVGRGTTLVLRGLAKFTGVEFLHQVAEFVGDLNDLFGGFRERADEVANALRSPEVAFVVVTSPNPITVNEAIFFGRKLTEAQLRPQALVVNRVHPLREAPDADRATLEAALARALDDTTAPGPLLDAMGRALEDERAIALGDRIGTQRLQHQFAAPLSYVEVPAFARDVHDIASLAALSRHLTGSGDVTDARGADARAVDDNLV
jgi:anion-transporting  ArsA/GET3 family ATPase